MPVTHLTQSVCVPDTNLLQARQSVTVQSEQTGVEVLAELINFLGGHGSWMAKSLLFFIVSTMIIISTLGNEVVDILTNTVEGKPVKIGAVGKIAFSNPYSKEDLD